MLVIRSFRHNWGIGLLKLTVLVGAQFGGILHALFEPHTWCAEHEQMTHHGEHVDDLESADTEDNHAQFVAASSNEESHAHCSVKALTERETLQAESDSVSLALISTALALTQQHDVDSLAAVLDYAPKNSPPTA